MTAQSDIAIRTGARAAKRPAWRANPLLRLGAPITAFYLIQTIVGLVALAVLGRLGDATLAAVGASGAIFGVLLALLYGVDAAAQAVIARRVGEGRATAVGQALTDSMAVSAPLGLTLALIAWFVGPTLVGAILHDARAGVIGAAYLRANAPQLLFLSFTIPINSAWIAQGRPGRALFVAMVLAPVQVAAIVVLAPGFGPIPSFGAAGAGWAASLSAFLAIPLQLALAKRQGAIPGFTKAAPTLRGIRAIVSLGWTISLQQSALQLGFMLAFVIVARLGVGSTAAANVLISLVTAPAQLSLGIGVAGGILAGQALGRGEVAVARHWGWRAGGLVAFICAPFALLGLFATRPLLGLFLKDPATLALAVTPARLVALGVIADNVARSICFALRGAGATRIGAAVPFAAQWLAMLPLGWWLAIGMHFGLLGFCVAQATVSAAEAVVTALFWSGSRWAARRL